ncbi:unnamed protein product [Sphagnum jensenii]
MSQLMEVVSKYAAASPDVDYVDQVLVCSDPSDALCHAVCDEIGTCWKVKDSKATKQLVALLSAPLEKYKDVVVVLKLSNYAQVMEHLDYETNKVMAVVLIQSVLSNSTMITVPETGYLLSCHNDVFLSL